jgi:hypothetical protein
MNDLGQFANIVAFMAETSALSCMLGYFVLSEKFRKNPDREFAATVISRLAEIYFHIMLLAALTLIMTVLAEQQP